MQARLVPVLLGLFFSPVSFAGDKDWTDPETGKEWRLLGHSVDWQVAVEGCDAMTTGDAAFRLPSLDEWWDAFDRIKDTELALELRTVQLRAWTSDALIGVEPKRIWTLYLLSGNAGGVPATDQAAATCIGQ